MTVTPDTKDWTWVLTTPCTECGYDASIVTREQLGPRLLDAADALVASMNRPDATVRPAPGVWSPTEYCCHVRDVCRVFAGRLHLMLSEDEPAFPNWDQDATALQERYDEQEPAIVTRQLLAEARTLAGAWDAVPAAAWDRRGVRSDGAVFTVLALGRYLLHDLVHHVHDVTR